MGLFSKKEKSNYYSLEKILSKNAQYNIIFGERSNGKTYAVLNYCLKNYFEKGEKFAIIRRYSTDVSPSKIRTFFSAFSLSEDEGKPTIVQKYSGNAFEKIVTQSGYFYPAFYDEDVGRYIKSNDWCGIAMSLVDSEHYKSTSFPEVTTILFDEFITRQQYLQDEFVVFMNILSTIIRDRKNVKIFMCGNTVNKYNPYFQEMGLKNAIKQAQGTIDIYTYGNSKLTVACEYCGERKNKESNHYFAFDNPKLNMITNGAWELDIYPHCPVKFDRADISFTFFVIFGDKILQCDIVSHETGTFIFCHMKTTEIREPENEVIYNLKRDNNPLHFQGLLPRDSRKINKIILTLIMDRKIFFQDNDVGDIFYNFLKESQNVQLQ